MIPETVILFVIAHPDFQWVASPEIIGEYVEVLRRPKFKLPSEIVEKWIEMFDELIAIVEADVEVDFPRDQKDAKFLACAVSCDADFLVTGDKDFDEAHKVVDTSVVSVSQFKAVCDADRGDRDASEE